MLAVGEPERERRLLDGLVAGGFALAGRCLDAASLVAVAPTDADVVLASTSLHRLTPATLLAVREAGLPLVLLADPESLARFREFAVVLPSDAPLGDVREALAGAVGRRLRRGGTASAAQDQAGAMGGGGHNVSSRHVIALTGGKGASGVTTLAVALAGALADRGRNVLLVDADLRLGAVGAHLDLDPRRGLFTFAYGPRGGRDDWARRLDEEVQDGPGFTVLGGIERAVQRTQIDSEAVTALLDAARRRYDHVVIDAGTVMDGLTPAGSEATLRRADLVLLVAVPDLVGLWQARAARDTLGDALGVPAERLGVILNRRAGRAHYAAEEVERAFGVPVLGVVPDDPAAARRALAEQLPLTRVGRRGVNRAVGGLATALLDGEPKGTVAGERQSWRPHRRLRWRRA